MFMTRAAGAMLMCLAASWVASCGRPDAGLRSADNRVQGTEEKILNVFWWSDFMAPDTIAKFEKKTGIKVRMAYYNSEEALETRMLTGQSGFDVVDPAAPYFYRRQVRSGAYLPLDKRQLPNLAHLDPAITSRVALVDPGNAHGVVYMWGTIGIGFNKDKVAQALADRPVNSWSVILDPANAARLAKCGIQILDSPAEVVPIVLRYLGKSPDSNSAQDLAEVSRVLMTIRPYVRNIETAGYLEAMANGDLCAAVGYNGDFIQARRRALETKSGAQIGYAIPDEGSIVYFNMVAIPRDAPHVANAHRFIDYLMDPAVIAQITNFTGYANPNLAANGALDASIAAYPTAAQRESLFVRGEDTPEQAREITRLWQRFKTGQ